MTKAMRSMRDDIKLIDIVIELLDARAPLSSSNPDILSLSKGKARLIVLNKADLADADMTKAFSERFKEEGLYVKAMDSRSRTGIKELMDEIMKASEKKLAENKRKGIVNRPLRAMVTGIPNVGKSTFINTLAAKASAKTGNKPGVTKGKQWIRLNRQIELMDTPGVLWPKFESRTVGERLAVLGTINDNILEKRELASSILKIYGTRGGKELWDRYELDITGFDLDDPGAMEAALSEISKKRMALLKGGAPDIDKAASILTEDFRAGRLGRVTIDSMADWPES